MNKNSFTYKKSGVDIKAADKFVKFISTISSNKKGKKKFNNIGGFGSITNIPKNLKNPKIVACTDGVGTKIEIANHLNKFDTHFHFLRLLRRSVRQLAKVKAYRHHYCLVCRFFHKFYLEN